MQTVSFIIVNQGDGSNGLVWFERTLTAHELDSLHEVDPDYFREYYELKFPDEFSVKGWAGINGIKFNNVTEYF